MSHILQPTSENSSTSLSYSSGLDEYPIDSDFEAGLVAQAENTERAMKLKARVIKREARTEITTSTSKTVNTPARDTAVFLQKPETSEANEARVGHIHGSTLAAIDPATGSFVYPIYARRHYPYLCPACDGKVHLRAGKKLRAHFAHYRSKSSCRLYDHRSESEEHKYAKKLLKAYLESRQGPIVIWHSCSRDLDSCPSCCGDTDSQSKEILKLKSDEQVVLEYTDPNRKWRADLAVLDGHGNLRFIVEVRMAHSTTTKRPEPWYEVDAKDVIKQGFRFKKEGKNINLSELRQNHSRICDACERVKERWAMNIPKIKLTREDGRWKLEVVPCLCCKKIKPYRYQWIGGRTRQVCNSCFKYRAEDVKARFMWSS